MIRLLTQLKIINRFALYVMQHSVSLQYSGLNKIEENVKEKSLKIKIKFCY